MFKRLNMHESYHKNNPPQIIPSSLFTTAKWKSHVAGLLVSVRSGSEPRALDRLIRTKRGRRRVCVTKTTDVRPVPLTGAGQGRAVEPR